MAEISKNDKVLYIGSGFFPTAPLLVAQTTDAKVVTIDINHMAIKYAKKTIKKNGLEKQITIEYGNGENYDLHPFSVIYIAINVWPIDNVLWHIATNGKIGLKVLCKSMNKDILSIISKTDLNKFFSVLKEYRNPKSYSILLKKIM